MTPAGGLRNRGRQAPSSPSTTPSTTKDTNARPLGRALVFPLVFPGCFLVDGRRLELPTSALRIR